MKPLRLLLCCALLVTIAGCGSKKSSGGMHGAMLAPVAKPTDFRGSFGRLMGELRPERGWVIAVVLLAVVSVALAVIGPKILANATNVIFAGAIGEQMPAGALFEVVPAFERTADERHIVRMFVIRTADDSRVPVRTAAIVNERELLQCEYGPPPPGEFERRRRPHPA